MRPHLLAHTIPSKRLEARQLMADICIYLSSHLLRILFQFEAQLRFVADRYKFLSHGWVRGLQV
jgi:hypothetical protein